MRARKDILAPTVIHYISYGAIMLPLGLVFSILFGWGVAGLVWLPVWLIVYRRPREQKNLSAAELAHIEQDPADAADVPARSSWRAAGMLAAQGLPGARNAANAGWHTAERAGRAERWSAGVVGM